MSALNFAGHWDANDYAQNSSQQYQWAKELMAKLPLQGHESLLDVGCGDGKVTVELAQCLADSGGSVLGVDSSVDMIRHASQQFPKPDYPNLEFMQCDARKLKLPSRFDVVFSNAALHWVDDHCAVLRGIHRYTNPNALVLMQMGGQGNVAEYFDVVKRHCASPRWRQYFKAWSMSYYFYGIADYQQWLEETGFNIERLELIAMTMKYGDAMGFSGWIRTTGMPYTLRVPADQREIFINELIDSYIAVDGSIRSGYICVDMVRLEVQARRNEK